MKYQMERDQSALARKVVRDMTTGVIYVYVRFSDRVDVHKFTLGHITESGMTGKEILARSVPIYRVTAGECSCEGYKFRAVCRHSTRVAELAESKYEGWAGAAE